MHPHSTATTTKQPRPASPSRFATAVSLTVVLAVTLLGVAVPEQVAAAGPWVLALGVLVGLPHGAADHLVAGWAGGTERRRPGLTAVVVGYISAAALAWGALSFAGPWALLALMVLSVVHFGLGDVVAEAERESRPAPKGGELAAAVLARGGPPLVLPLVCWPDTLDAALDAFDPRVTELLSPSVRLTALLALAVCCVVTAGRAWRRGRPLVVIELVVLTALFTTTPPLAAFGVYFGGWHSLRHLARMLEADPRNSGDLAAGRWRPPVRRFLSAAAVPTAGALVAIVVLAAVAAQTPLLVPTLSILLALTVPHVVFVAMLDAASGCWGRPRAAQPRPE